MQHLKAIIIVVILGALAYWGFNTLFGEKNTQRPSYVSMELFEKEGVPDFHFVNLGGQKRNLKEFEGKVVILNFWASWCGPCIEEVPSLIKLVEEFKGRVKLITISGDSSRSDIDVFMKSFPGMNNPNIQNVWDEDRSLMQMFDVARLPESMVLGKDHKLVKKLVGSIDWYNADSIAYMDSLLSDGTPESFEEK